jgi:hypothetical protein
MATVLLSTSAPTPGEADPATRLSLSCALRWVDMDVLAEDACLSPLAQSDAYAASPAEPNEPFVVFAAFVTNAPCEQHLPLAAYAVHASGYPLLALDGVSNWLASLCAVLREDWQQWILAEGVARALATAHPNAPVTAGICSLSAVLLQRLATGQDQEHALRFRDVVAQYASARTHVPPLCPLLPVLLSLLLRIRGVLPKTPAPPHLARGAPACAVSDTGVVRPG